jgi:hypothetical protein
MIEAAIIGIVQQVLGDYISGLLSKRQSERNRSELVALIEGQIKATRALDAKIDAVSLAVRELDVIVKKDTGLTWQDDQLVVRPSGRIRKSMPSTEDALSQLVASVTARRRELKLPLTPAEAEARQAPKPAEGDLIPPESMPAQAAPKATPDLEAEVLSLPTEVLREKERRRRQADRG